MNNIKDLKNALWEQLNKEFNNYKEELVNKSPIDIIDKSYETTIKESIVDIFDPDSIELTKKQAEILLSTDGLLNHLYDRWLKKDGNIYESVQEELSDEIQKMYERYNEINSKTNCKKEKER